MRLYAVAHLTRQAIFRITAMKSSNLVKYFTFFFSALVFTSYTYLRSYANTFAELLCCRTYHGPKQGRFLIYYQAFNSEKLIEQGGKKNKLCCSAKQPLSACDGLEIKRPTDVIPLSGSFNS